jgi:hypothetical protein
MRKYEHVVVVKFSLCFNLAPRYEGVLGEWKYSSTHFWPRHWMGVSGQIHASAALSPGEKSLVPIVYGAGWVPEPVWTWW